MTEENNTVNPLEMSDEDIENMATPPGTDPDPEESSEEEGDGESENQEGEEEEESEASNEDPDNESEEEGDEDESDGEENEGEKASDEEGNPEDKENEEGEEESDSKDVDTEDKSKEEVDNTPDYEAEYKKLLEPFNASGNQIQVNNVDEAIRLMQMGADYNKKMTGLKPSMKLLKMLQNNELLDEDKLNYLIDLDKKNPDAITKLIKESGIDPLQVDVDADTEYKPTAYTVNDKEVELDRVLADIEHTGSYANTIEVISNKWDESSKRTIYDNPTVITAINAQVANGDYEQIAGIVANQQALGKLSGLSDIMAYKQVGDYLQQQNMLVSQKVEPAPEVKEATPQKRTIDNPKLKNRKKAAGTTKTTPSKKGKGQVHNPLSMSDEEFEKQSTPVF